MHRVFISYHHEDRAYKEELLQFNRDYGLFVDGSVDTGDISDDLGDQEIREKIRDNYLRDTTVTAVLVGRNTKGRKHVYWEICSSMIDGKINRRSGILVVLLPEVSNTNSWFAPYANEKSFVYPEWPNWVTYKTQAEYENNFPDVPNRIVDNLMKPNVDISVVPWQKLNTETLPFLIENAFNARASNQYDLGRFMRRASAPIR